MKKRILSSFIQIVLLLGLIQITGCNEYEEPALINNPDQTYSSAPVITSIEPADSAIAGVREIIINGSNFAVNGIDTNWIYIGGEAVQPKSVTANKIVVYRPSKFGDNFSVKVVVPTALTYAKVENYKIEEPIKNVSDFSYENYPLTAMECDNNENLYIATRRKILKLESDGITLNSIGSYGSDFAKITDIKLGLGGFLFAAISKNEVYKINVNTGAEEVYVKYPKKMDKIDFDKYGNLYAGRRDGVYMAKTDLSIVNVEKYDGDVVVELRVINDYLYVATAKEIRRNKINNSDGQLGDYEQVVSLNNLSEFSTVEISSFNIDKNGMIILCLKGHPKYSLFVAENNGEITPYYQKSIIPLSVDQLVYGSGRFMYLNRGSLDRDSLRLQKMGMTTTSATYYGRGK